MFNNDDFEKLQETLNKWADQQQEFVELLEDTQQKPQQKPGIAWLIWGSEWLANKKLRLLLVDKVQEYNLLAFFYLHHEEGSNQIPLLVARYYVSYGAPALRANDSRLSVGKVIDFEFNARGIISSAKLRPSFSLKKDTLKEVKQGFLDELKIAYEKSKDKPTWIKPAAAFGIVSEDSISKVIDEDDDLADIKEAVILELDPNQKKSKEEDSQVEWG